MEKDRGGERETEFCVYPTTLLCWCIRDMKLNIHDLWALLEFHKLEKGRITGSVSANSNVEKFGYVAVLSENISTHVAGILG